MDLAARAQDAVLTSLLEGRPLPGSTMPLVFPDLVDTDPDDLVLVESPTLAALDVAPQLQRVEDPSSLRRPGRTYLLEFMPPEPLPGRTSVRLRLDLVDPELGRATLGELLVTFQARDDELVMADEPTIVAT